MRRTAAVALSLAALARANAAPTGDARAALDIYTQPAPGDDLLVVTPSVNGHITATQWLKFNLSWLSDVVTGATPRTYGPPDVVSAATRFSEVRNVVGAGAELDVGPAAISLGYSYGSEHDYVSHLLRGGLTLDLAQHDTILAASYNHSFDRICDLAQPNVPLILRQPLDRPSGCFSSLPQLTTESLNSDTLELSFIQTLSRHWIGTLVGSYQHLSGFQSNPYRTVRLSNGLFVAQESHPRLRDRGALTARVRYAIAATHGSLGFDLRLYRDTWAVQSLTGEASYEQPFSRARPAWRFLVHARGYVQSGAVFYRDAGNADSYDRVGPAGSYWTADQALAPLADFLTGARFTWNGSRPQKRYWRAFTDMEASFAIDYMKLFALSPDPPNALRADYWLGALLIALSLTGNF
jgi:hypothetical protein